MGFEHRLLALLGMCAVLELTSFLMPSARDVVITRSFGGFVLSPSGREIPHVEVPWFRVRSENFCSGRRHGAAVPLAASHNPEAVQEATLQWLHKVVVGLNLCPWAYPALQQMAVRIVVSPAENDEDLMEHVTEHIRNISQTPEGKNATTLVVTEHLLSDFFDYNEFAQEVDDVIDKLNLRGVVQLATFHPDYQFGHSEPSDAENWTNRSPYPILHLLREQELEQALDTFRGDPDKIWQRNEQVVREKGADKMRALLQSCINPHK